MASRFTRSKSRRWPVALAVLSVLSLYYLGHFVPTPERIIEEEVQKLVVVRGLIKDGRFDEASERARLFLQERPGSIHRPHATHLLALSTIRKAAVTPGYPVSIRLLESHRHLTSAYRLAEPLDDKALRNSIFNAQRELVMVLRESGLYSDARTTLKNLLSQLEIPRDQKPEIQKERKSRKLRIKLDLSDVCRIWAASMKEEEQDERRTDLLQEAAAHVEEYLALAEGDEEIEGLLVKASLLWQQKRFQEMIDMLDDGLNRHGDNPDASPKLRFYRGKALARCGKGIEATVDLDAAARSKCAAVNELAGLHLIYMLCNTSDADCRRHVKALPKNSRYYGFALLFQGLHAVTNGRTNPFQDMAEGLALIESPSFFQQTMEEEHFDINLFYDAVRRSATESSDPEQLEQLGVIVERFSRLMPERLYPIRDSGLFHRRAADALMTMSAKRRERGDEKLADQYARRAAALYYRAGEVFLGLSQREDLEQDEISQAYFDTARSFFDGGWYAKAAEQYYRFYLFRSTENHEGLYWEGIAYSRAGILRVDDVGRRSAIRSLSEYVFISPPGNILVARALLERGKIFLKLGEYPSAVSDFERVTLQPGISPESDEWSEGKRLRGVSELRLALDLQPNIGNDPDMQSRFIAALRNAQLQLSEYIDRYVREGAPDSLGLITIFHLARVQIADRNWEEAETLLRRVIGMGSVLKERLNEEADEALLQSHFLLAEALLASGRDADAHEAFGLAYNRYVARPERLWALLGRARTSLRIGRPQDAFRFYQRGRELFEKNRETYAVSFAGFGEEFWKETLDTVRDELRRSGATGNGGEINGGGS